MSRVIYHLAFRHDWEAGLVNGHYRAPSLAEEGFIHASGDEEQMLRVASRLFAGRTDLLVLDVETALLDQGSPVIREPARSGEIYPHIYGPIALNAVARIRKLVPDQDSEAGFTLLGGG